MKRKRTKRERQMLLNKKRFKHELRKRRKDRTNPTATVAGYAPNIEAMFRKKDKEGHWSNG